MKLTELVAIGAISLFGIGAVSPNTGELEKKVNQTATQIYNNVHKKGNNHKHMISRTGAKEPYMQDAYLIPCAEGHATCPGVAGAVVYDPKQDVTYIFSTWGSKNKVEHVDITIIKGKLPNLPRPEEYEPNFEFVACGMKDHSFGGNRLKEVGINPKDVLAYIHDASPLGSLGEEFDKYCSGGAERQPERSGWYEKSMKIINFLPKLYASYAYQSTK